MSQKANPRLIGVFILIAFFVSIGTFFMMNRDRFFSHTTKYVLSCQGSVKGLNVGSPVVFNGVPIGRIINISFVAGMGIDAFLLIQNDKAVRIRFNNDGNLDFQRLHVGDQGNVVDAPDANAVERNGRTDVQAFDRS